MSHRNLLNCQISLASLLLLGNLPAAWSQAGAPAPARLTVASGDLGGKIFGRVPDPAKTKHYYVAAEPELWDYAPMGADVVCGKPLPPPLVASRKAAKLRYVQYTDATFGARLMGDPRLGILGPVMRGVVGEFLAVTFLNRTGQPLSMHPHGVKYDKDNEGAYYEPGPGLGAGVAPGARFTYVWQLDEASGPQPGEPSSKGWLYHSHVNGDDEINAGLMGFIVVTDPKRARPDGTPSDVDREMAALFLIFDESGLGEAEREAAEYATLPGGGPPPKSWAEVQQLTEQGGRYAINGRVFGNLAALEMNEGERVRWYLFGLGSETDLHTAHWHGLRVLEEGRRRTDVVELLPASMKVADMVADNPGSWLLHCHVAEHMKEGMFARVVVHSKVAPKAGRDPDQAFFLPTKSGQSWQIKHAEGIIGSAAAEIRLAAAVTVFEAYSVFTQPVQFQLGKRSVTFKPDARGQAVAEGCRLNVRNAGKVGVVYGGVMEFEIVLTGAGWLEELKALGLGTADGNTNNISAPMTLRMGEAQHRIAANITCHAK